MGRRAEPAKVKAGAKRPLGGKSPKDEGANVRDPETRLAEALEQQTATAEILRVIGTSPTDTNPVFEAIARSAARLCGAQDVFILRTDGAVMRLAAGVGPLSASAPADFAVPITRG